MGLLVHNGTTLPNGQRLAYDTKIRDVIPEDEWKLRDEYMSDHVEVRDLLCKFRSGCVGVSGCEVWSWRDDVVLV